MYVLRYYAHGGYVLNFLCVGYGQAEHVKWLGPTDSLWLVPGTLEA